jgi:uncharacterized protein YeaO (DUF488 family)
MAIRVVRLGSPRNAREGVRIGTARRPPRGVKKEDYARLDYYDVWLPDLAPSAETVAWAQSEALTPKRWAAFVKRYRREMKAPPAERLLSLLAALSAQSDFSVGCYCADESRCHRAVLRELLIERGAKIV